MPSDPPPSAAPADWSASTVPRAPTTEVDHIEIRRSTYHDSVTLMRIARAAADAPGILAAQIAMATHFNMELAAGLGFAIPGDAGPNDLMIALRGVDDDAVTGGLAAFDAALVAAHRSSRQGSATGSGPAPRTVRAAAARAPDAAVVLISVPGPYVLGEAMDAIAAGRHPMIFSDNVPLEHEVALKRAAAAAGVLVMGPDCGTAIVGGVGLGFANVLGSGVAADPVVGMAGAVGVVAASGTGAQQLTSLLDDAGVPITAVLGLGGRDLSEAVGGRSALTALAMLQADPSTDHIVLISKPPHPATADKVLAAARAGTTPVTTILLGRPEGGAGGDITAGVEQVLATLGVAVPKWKTWGVGDLAMSGQKSFGPQGVVRGLFCGGTLADEAMLLLGVSLGDIRSNIPLRPDLALPGGGSTEPGLPDLTDLGHVVLDLGDDEFTMGRPHPMIDPTIRLDLLGIQAADGDVAVLLLDVVLGHGTEADPAARLAPAIRSALRTRAESGSERPLHVVVSLCGTSGDPQDRERQAAALVDAGAVAYASNAAAARAAAALADPRPARKETS